ncbi:MAG: sulfite exporter TauE/SafE family protein [Acidobacteriota bacterium]|nr:MAG: sulfite exporter TauE/SafE family protein [Acidobacteriota bacterium]
MSILELSVPFTLGVLGSLHCIQMCGPLVLSYSLPLSSHSRRNQVMAHLFYNLGRMITYGALGAVAGAAGAMAGSVGRIAGVEHVVTITVGILMIMAGVLMTGWIPQGPLSSFVALRPLSSLGNRVGRMMKSAHPANKLLMGLILGFLPCGLVYSALLKAVETAQPLSGALTMVAFGTGTAWSLLLLGLFSATVTPWLRRYGNQLAALGVTLIGIYLLYKGIMATMAPSHMHH